MLHVHVHNTYVHMYIYSISVLPFGRMSKQICITTNVTRPGYTEMVPHESHCIFLTSYDIYRAIFDVPKSDHPPIPWLVDVETKMATALVTSWLIANTPLKQTENTLPATVQLFSILELWYPLYVSICGFHSQPMHIYLYLYLYRCIYV